MVDQLIRMRKTQYVSKTKKTYVSKINKFLVVCLTIRPTLTGVRSKRQYLTLAAERLVLSNQGLTALIVAAGVRLRHLLLEGHLSKTDSKSGPKSIR